MAVAVAAAALLLAGCLGGGGATVSDIRERGYLAVGTSADYPPFSFIGNDGRPDGLEPALARLIAAELGVETEVKVYPVDALWGALDRGEVDVVVSGLDPNGMGRGAALFTEPYLPGGSALVARQGEEAPSSLALQGRVVGALLKTPQVWEAEREGAMTVRQYPNVPSLLHALEVRDIDVAVLPLGIAELLGRRVPGLVVEPRPGEAGAVALAVRMRNTRLKQDLDDLLATLAADGRLDDLVAHWFKIPRPR